MAAARERERREVGVAAARQGLARERKERSGLGRASSEGKRLGGKKEKPGKEKKIAQRKIKKEFLN